MEVKIGKVGPWSSKYHVMVWSGWQLLSIFCDRVIRAEGGQTLELYLGETLVAVIRPSKVVDLVGAIRNREEVKHAA